MRYLSIIIGLLIFIYNTNSNSWQKIGIKPSSQRLNAIHSIDGHTLSVGNFGVIKISNDSGETWKTIRGRYDLENLNGITATADKFFIVGDRGTLMRSDNYGEDWIKFTLTDLDLNDVTFNNNNGVIIGDSGTILVSEDDGQNWEKVSNDINNNLNKVFINNDKVIAIGDSGTCIISDDLGRNWRRIDLGISGNLISYSIHSSNIIYIGGDNKSLIRSDNEFDNWDIFDSEYLPDVFYSLLQVNDSLLLAGIVDMPSTKHSFSTDSGNTWKHGIFSGVPVFDFSRNGNYAFLCGNGGGIIKIDLFNPIPAAFHFFKTVVEVGEKPYSFSKVNGMDEKHLIAANYKNVYLSQDSGVTWKHILELDKPNVAGLEYNNDNNIIVVADSSVWVTEDGSSFFRHWPIIYSSNNRGESWNKLVFTDELAIRGFSYHNSGYAIIHGIKYYIKTVDNGMNWTIYDTPSNIIIDDLQVLSNSVVYILTWANGKYQLIKTIDDFINTETISLPMENSSYEKLYFINEQIGWIVMGNGFNQKSNVIYRTTDGGKTWDEQLSESFEMGLSLMDIKFTDYNNGICLGTRGLAFTTTDGGAHWIKNSFQSDGFVDNTLYYPNPTIAYASNGIDIFRYTDSTLTSVEQIFVDNQDSYLSAYPNPFSESTTINYELEMAGYVSIKVFDALGNEVSELVNEHSDSGLQSCEFNAKNLPSGVYYYSIKIGNSTQTGKLVLMK